MTGYEIVDFLCDLVNPVLLGACILMIGKLAATDRSRGIKFGAYLVWNLATTYSLLFLDNTLSLFAGLSLDYSTHTAFALSAVIILFLLSSHRWLLVSVMVLYGIAMLYQDYHTVGDLCATVIVVAPFFAMGYRLFCPSSDNVRVCI